MNNKQTSRSMSAIFAFIFLAFAYAVPAQKSVPSFVDGDGNPPAVVLPFDFNDLYYARNGVDVTNLWSRHTGDDGWSVIDTTGGANHTNVRVIATVPAYDQNGETVFWAPLGDLPANGFTDDRQGVRARHLAQLYPIYLFPDRNVQDVSNFPNKRQASLMDNSNGSRIQANPIGLRAIFHVIYTQKAFDEDAKPVMTFFADKNGLATDGTPIIKSVADISFLLANDYISVKQAGTGTGMEPASAEYTVAPMLTLPGAIAADAFLWQTRSDGTPLPAEAIFLEQFNCRQQGNDGCPQKGAAR